MIQKAFWDIGLLSPWMGVYRDHELQVKGFAVKDYSDINDSHVLPEEPAFHISRGL